MKIMKADRDYVKLADLPRTPNPHPETRILSHDGFDCEVRFNYVDQGEYGLNPANHWWAVLKPNSHNLMWRYPLRKEVTTLDEACKVIMPIFKKVIERMKKRK